MAHYCICSKCCVRFDRDKIQAVKTGARRYGHATCYPDNKDFVKMEAPKKAAADPDLEMLKEYISKVYGTKANWPLISKQIKEYHEVNGYSYSGMYKSLVYFYEVKKNSLDNSHGGIGIIPFTYQAAYDYYLNLFLISNANSKIENMKEYVSQEKEIVIKEPRRKTSFFKKLFNLEDEE